MKIDVSVLYSGPEIGDNSLFYYIVFRRSYIKDKDLSIDDIPICEINADSREKQYYIPFKRGMIA